MAISRFEKVKDNTPRPEVLTWGELRTLLMTHDVRAEKDGPLWSPTVYRDGARRGNEGVVEITAAVADIDDGWPLSAAVALLDHLGCEYVVHSTHSHTPSKPKYRVVLPLAAPVAMARWPGAWDALRELLGGHVDKGTKDAARIYYLPSHFPGAPAEVRVGHGALIDLGVLASLSNIRKLPLGEEAAELVRGLACGAIVTDGWSGKLCDWLVDLCVDAGLSPEEIERLHRHRDPVSHTSIWSARARRTAAGAKHLRLRRSTLLEEPAFAAASARARPDSDGEGTRAPEGAAAVHPPAAGGAAAGWPIIHVTIDEDGDPVETIRLAENGWLEYVRTHYSFPENGGKISHPVTTVLVPWIFRPVMHTDETGQLWVDWTGRDGPVRGPVTEFCDVVSKRYSLRGSAAHAIPIWLEALRVTGPVATRLSLDLPDGAGRPWRVPAEVYARESGLARHPNTIVASWYRPRSRNVSLGLLQELLTFATRYNQQAVLCYVAGAPVAAKLCPTRPRVYLEQVGESGVGKTEYARTAIAVLWGLGGAPREFLDLSALTSEFRWEIWFSTTDLPLLVDESLLDSTQRRRLRRAVSGGLGSRGRRDQLVYALPHTAAVVLTTNVETSELDSAPSERHGDVRRRLRLSYDEEDKAALKPERIEEFHRFQRGILDAPIDPEGGGAALWLLRDHESRDACAVLRALDAPTRSDVQYVLDVGAAVLGVEPVRDAGAGEEPEAEEAFLGWLRAQAARWIRLTTSCDHDGNLKRPDDPLIPLMAVRTDDPKSDAHTLDGGEWVFVTAGLLRFYESESRRTGRTSPWPKLPALRALASVTGQAQDDISGPHGGLLRWIGGKRERVAVLRPWDYLGSAAGSEDGERA